MKESSSISKFDIDFFKPRSKKDREILGKRGYIEIPKEKALEYLKSHRSLLPKGLYQDETFEILKNGNAFLAYCGHYNNEEINDVCLMIRERNDCVCLPLGVYDAVFTPQEVSVSEALKGSEKKTKKSARF